jgi:hypothetical protein
MQTRPVTPIFFRLERRTEQFWHCDPLPLYRSGDLKDQLE